MELACGAPLYYIQYFHSRAKKLVELKRCCWIKPAPITCCAEHCGLCYYNYIIINVARGSYVLPCH